MKKTKEELKNESQLHQEALEKEFAEIVSEGKETAKKALFIGGGFLVTYLIIRIATQKKTVSDMSEKRAWRQEPEQKSSMASSIGKMLLTQAAILAIKFAKDRIKEYLENRMETDEKYGENDS
jgi:hypothetical protein